MFKSIVLSILAALGGDIDRGAAALTIAEHPTLAQCEKHIGRTHNARLDTYENKGYEMKLKLNNTRAHGFNDNQTSTCVQTVKPEEAQAIYIIGVVYQNNGFGSQTYETEVLYLGSPAQCGEIDSLLASINPHFTPPELGIMAGCTDLTGL
ncbi:hypothetical protein [Nitrosomonas marina]|uniref:Uncharacterized protein n=1 Tax=Nitrosomonas marina TaxID=917 RepID=A0A1H8GK11_9PROT|nr:hypothetical protein [Nitrosomonas marina]SEN44140.1 hypothetical protein SAMN05216325_11858 [Nitrosomonas marina]